MAHLVRVSAKLMACAFGAAAVWVAGATAQDGAVEDEVWIDEVLAEEFEPATALSDESLAARRITDLPQHVSIVVGQDGELDAGYRQESICREETCSPAVIEISTGDVVFFADRWMAGYLETGIGQEVWRVEGAVLEPLQD